MALLHEAINEKKLDVRVIERNVKRGDVTSTEVERSLKQLPDDAANAEYISIADIAAQQDDSGSGSTH